MTYIGVDLSRWQGDIPETGLEHLDFAYVQATYGSKTYNAYAVQQCAALRKQGVRVGFYHYVTMDPLIEQVLNFQIMAHSLGGSPLPLALDIEEPDPGGWGALSVMLMDFARQIEAWPSEALSHQKAMIYCNLDFAAILSSSGFPWGRYVWLADPNPGAPHRSCLVLQGGPRIVADFPAAVDPDTFMGSEADWLAFTGQSNPWEPPNPSPAPPTPPAPLQEAPVAISGTVINYRPGQYDFFQQEKGRLLHYFHAAGAWHSEDLATVTHEGGLAPTFQGAPTAYVVGGVAVVVIEDNNGVPWIFQQGASGDWEFVKA